MMNQPPTTSAPEDAEPPTYCLYFLVCLANTGDLAGLFKLGITNHLPTRHHHHTRNWEEFDLKRSALLWARDRWEVEVLERMLKKRFKEWRRYPGHDHAGHTEFFSVDCLAEMLALVRKQIELGIGAHLRLEVDPAECARKPMANGVSALTWKERGELVAQENALKRQEKAERGEHITRELEVVLGITKGYKEHLVWVNLERWYELQTPGAQKLRKDKTLIDLYFGRFQPARPHRQAEARQQPVTQASFAQWVEQLQWTAVTTHSSPLSKYRPKAMFYLREPLVHPGDQLPHPVCADTVLLRVECGRCIPPYSILAQFEALADLVGSRPRWDQTAFGW